MKCINKQICLVRGLCDQIIKNRYEKNMKKEIKSKNNELQVLTGKMRKDIDKMKDI